MLPKRNAQLNSSLEKAALVMDAFLRPPHDYGLAEIVEITGLERSAAQRVLYTLHQAGWLMKDARARRFTPSIRFLEGAFAYLATDPLMIQASPHLISLARELGETVNLARLDGTDIVYVNRMPAHRAAFAATLPGRRIPALNTSSGRAILACRAEAEIRAACDSWPVGRFQEATLTDRDALFRAVMEAKAQGFAMAEEQVLVNELGLAAPIRDQAGQAIAALQVAVSNLRWTPSRLRAEIAPALVETSKAISPPAETRE